VARNDKDSELVLGLITTVGTEVNGVIKAIKDQLSFFHYDVDEVIVSNTIISQFESTPKKEWTSEFERISHYMDLGNKIRKSAGDNSILMKGVARQLYQKRDKDSNNHPKPRKRIAYIIKSIKHPAEVEFMRDTYGEGFHLIGVTSSNERRIEYLTKRKGLTPEQADLLLERDANEDLKQGQHTQDAFQHADYFINITEDSDYTYNSVSRLIDLLFGDPFICPSFDEYAMFMAYASSLRSADLSRQIGAVIAKDNEILASGANDCPRAGGGLYWPVLKDHGKYEDEPDGRDYMFKEGYDSNKIEQRKMIDSILKAFELEVTEESIYKAKRAGIGDLTEYGRVVHGEMEALLTCARNNISCRGATLYATTFPCHNCAKHIIAAGLKRVVYIEPYPKSKAFQFYPAEITDGKTIGNKVVFEPFTGVGPQRFVDLFAVSSARWYARKRKNNQGYKLKWDRDKAELRNPISLINYLEAEKLALMVFEDETVALKGDNNKEEEDNREEHN
jgi:deoxycytidylate deaminase